MEHIIFLQFLGLWEQNTQSSWVRSLKRVANKHKQTSNVSKVLKSNSFGLFIPDYSSILSLQGKLELSLCERSKQKCP